ADADDLRSRPDFDRFDEPCLDLLIGTAVAANAADDQWSVAVGCYANVKSLARQRTDLALAVSVGEGPLVHHERRKSADVDLGPGQRLPRACIDDDDAQRVRWIERDVNARRRRRRNRDIPSLGPVKAGRDDEDIHLPFGT